MGTLHSLSFLSLSFLICKKYDIKGHAQRCSLQHSAWDETLDTIQMPVRRGLDKQTVDDLHVGILYYGWK